MLNFLCFQMIDKCPICKTFVRRDRLAAHIVDHVDSGDTPSPSSSSGGSSSLWPDDPIIFNEEEEEQEVVASIFERSASDEVEEFGTKGWSVEETKGLIEAMRVNLPRLKDKKFKGTKVWADIACQTGGRSVAECQVKWRNLLKTYRKNADSKKKTGRGGIRWIFFEKMDEFLCERPEMTPLSLASTLEGIQVPETSTPKRKISPSSVDDELTKHLKTYMEEDLKLRREEMETKKKFLELFEKVFNK